MAAGLGFKTFTTGEVLTAADTNGYLMQGVLVFASSAARASSVTSPQEGQYSYLKDTNSTEYYDGAAWIAAPIGDITGVTAGTGISGGGTSGTVTITNSMATEIAAKGDLIVGTGAATFDNLAAGADGSSIVADSSTSTGLRYQSNFAAGKNAIINGDLQVWQRGTTFSVAGTSFTADRFRVVAAGATVSRQTFTPGTAPVAGYEGQFYFNQLSTTNNQNYDTSIRVENARTYAGQTVTLSFFARSTAGAQPLNMAIYQSFGTGGSPSADAQATYVSGSGTPYTPTASWVRYTFTLTMPSVSGKTFGTNNDSYLNVRLFQYTTTATNTSIDIWGVQLEQGSVATAFQTATGTFQGELAACQRYYYRLVASNGGSFGTGYTFNTTGGNFVTFFPVSMRIAPTALEQTGTAGDYRIGTTAGFACTSVPTYNIGSISNAVTTGTSSGMTAGHGGQLYSNTSNIYLGWSAEL